MKNSQQPLEKSSSANRSRRVLFVIGGVGVLLFLGFWFGRDAAAAQMAKSAEKLSESSQERYLLNLSAASWRTDGAQKALAEHYKTHLNYLKAAQAYHDGSTALRHDAAGMYAEAGKYDKAIVIYTNLAKKDGEQYSYLLAKALINYGQESEGCELRGKLPDKTAKDLVRLCEIVEKTKPNREEIYELADMGADSIVEKYFFKSTQKTVADWLVLAQIYQKRGELDRAKAALQQGSETFPYDQELTAAKQSLQ